MNNYLYGLSIYDRSEDAFIRIPEGAQRLNMNFITHFHETNDSTIYFSGNGGLQRATLSDENYRNIMFDSFQIPQDLKGKNKDENTIWHISQLSPKELLLSSTMGFFVFDMENEQFYNHESFLGLPQSIGFSTYVDTVRHHIWYPVSAKPMLVYNYKTQKSHYINDLVVKNGETYFHQKDNKLYFKENGFDLNIINMDTYEVDVFQAGENSLINHKDRWSRRFLETADGSLFIASSDDSRFQHIPSISPQVEEMKLLDKKDNETSAVYEDDDYFAATFSNHGFHIKNKKTQEVNHFHKDNSIIVDDLIMNLFRLKDGRFVLTAKPHNYIFDPEKKSFEILGRAIFFRDGIELSNGELWLFPGGGARVLRYVKDVYGKYIPKEKNDLLNSIPNVRGVREVEDGNKWLISSVKGLYKLDKTNQVLGHWEATSAANSPVGNSMECLYVDKKNRVWIGALEGLSIFEEGKNIFHNFTRKDGLNDTSISDIVEDEHGRIWISTFDELYYFDEELFQLKMISKNATINQHFSQRGMYNYKAVSYTHLTLPTILLV